MGRPRSVCDDCVLRAVAAGEAPVSSTPEVAARLEMSDQGVRDRLDQLADRDYLATDRKGRTRLWWLVAAGYRRLDGQQCGCTRGYGL